MSEKKKEMMKPTPVDIGAVSPGNALTVPRRWYGEVDDKAFITTLPMATVPERIAVFNLMTNTERLQNHLGETFEVTDIILTSRLVVDEETGEESPGVLMVMVRPQAPHYTTGSKVVIPAVARIHAMIMPAPWHPPIKVRVDEKVNPTNKRRYYSITIQP
jgi:Phage Single-stranded DNA-binding protein